MRIATTRLPNGVTVVTAPMPSMESVSIGVWACVGSRHEPAPHGGIAHFVEHLVFKGTRRRTASEILRAVEGIGGTINAFTELDHTCYYAKAAADHMAPVADVLFDLYSRPAFPASDIPREREVIEEEIIMYREQPGQHVDDVLGETAWPRHPLGRPVTGTPRSLAATRRPALRAFVANYYGGRNTLVTVAGRVTPDEVLDIVRPMASRIPPGRRPRSRQFQLRPTSTFALGHDQREIEQTHFALGFHTPGATADERHALRIVSVLMGENMSSRLFQRLREDEGLCYNVQTDSTLVHETGLFSVYAGVDPDKLERSLAITVRELNRLAARPPTRRELREAIDYTIGTLRLSLESTSQRMLWAGEALVAHGRVPDPSEVCDRLAAVTAREISALAARIFRPANAALALVGPATGRATLDRCLARLA